MAKKNVSRQQKSTDKMLNTIGDLKKIAINKCSDKDLAKLNKEIELVEESLDVLKNKMASKLNKDPKSIEKVFLDDQEFHSLVKEILEYVSKIESGGNFKVNIPIEWSFKLNEKQYYLGYLTSGEEEIYLDDLVTCSGKLSNDNHLNKGIKNEVNDEIRGLFENICDRVFELNNESKEVAEKIRKEHGQLVKKIRSMYCKHLKEDNSYYSTDDFGVFLHKILNKTTKTKKQNRKETK